jgi:hypothetical protein
MAGLPAAPTQSAQTVAPSTQGPYAPVQTQDQSFGTTAQVQNAPTPDAYMAAIQAQMAPAFEQSRQQLNAQQQAMGTLTSGAGNYANQQLTAQNNATLAGMEAPLLQQGFAQQATANEQNAAAQNAAMQAGLNRQQGNNQFNAGQANAYNTLLQNQTWQGAQNANAQNLQGQEFNATQLQNANLANQNAANALQLAQLGYGNADYLAQMQMQGNLIGQGLEGQNWLANTGLTQQNQAYNSANTAGQQYAAAIGAAQQIPTTQIQTGYTGYQPGSSSDTSAFGGWGGGGANLGGTGSMEGTGEYAGGH